MEIKPRLGELNLDGKKMWIDYEQWEWETKWLKEQEKGVRRDW